MLLGTKATPEAIARIRALYGLDEPLWTQYLYYLEEFVDRRDGPVHTLQDRRSCR